MACAIVLIAVLEPVPETQAQSTEAQITFASSIKEPVATKANAVPISKNTPTVVRSQLTDAETQETIDFSIALKMRNFTELQQRIRMGETIPLEEMSAKYFPVSADLENVRRWLSAQGFEVLPAAQYELSIFARGTVAQLQRSFGVKFARVQFAGEEHTSAVTAPTLPADVAEPVLSINGLQPHLHPFIHSVKKPIGPTKSISNQPPFLVSEIAKAYDASTANGAGQTIGIVIDTFPLDSDLTTFWADNSVPQSLSNIEKIQVVAGSLPSPEGEETLDASWSSGIASGAKIRIYATTTLAFTNIDKAYQTIINDMASQTGMRQVSLSFGLGELYEAPAQIQTDGQYFASMAGGGISVFVSSGDGGASPGPGGHDHNGNIQVEAPADDPNVTGVGGTSLSLNPNGTVAGETAWFDGGGGQSVYFSRLSWQPGSGTISGSGRLVPDVSLVADPNTGALLILDGFEYQIGGTSWSAPVWAGICARLNQVRNSRGNPALGLLGPKIYPLLGSSSFRDITGGTNGGYSAGPGFDLCTGIGVPDVNKLILAVEGPIQQPPGSGIARDFDNDGSADLVWENTTTGQRAIWLMKNGSVKSTKNLPTLPASWHVAADGDFLGTGQSDLVLENTVTGAHAIWILNQGVLATSLALPTVGGGWHVVGAGDFDGDGKADVVLENTGTGVRVIWILKDGNFDHTVNLGTVPPSWHIVGVGDFLGNGQSDLVWENMTTGARVIWVMNGTSLDHTVSVATISPVWHIGGTGDFNGDGQADLILENTMTGQRVFWMLNAGKLQSATVFSTIPTTWHAVNH
jgi:kumamolisin